jgi:hypothetical protein
MTTPAGRARTSALLAGCLVVLVVLGGCTDDPGARGESTARVSDPSGPTSGTPEGSTAPRQPDATATTEAPPAAPKASRDARGQRAFARHVMDLWGYALRTNDAGPLTAAGPGPRPCDGCRPFARELAARERQGWSVDFPGLDVHRVRLGSQRGAVLARAVVDIPASDAYNADGSYRSSNPPHPGAHFEVRMRYAERGYRLLSFTVF